jgi:beta-glucosidase
VIDNWTRQQRGDDFFGSGTIEERGTISAQAGVAHRVRVEFCNVRAPADGDEDEAVMDANPGVRLGGAVVYTSDALMESAVIAAADADAVIAVVGLNADWETEGYDRTTLALPGRTDELVEKVLAANANTVIVTQSVRYRDCSWSNLISLMTFPQGSAIEMPWADKAPAIVHAWYLGNATGDAIADVLFGRVNPSGKLSLTFPKRLVDVPAHGHFNSENGKLWYSEDLFVGYKHYQHRDIEPLWSFG